MWTTPPAAKTHIGRSAARRYPHPAPAPDCTIGLMRLLILLAAPFVVWSQTRAPRTQTPADLTVDYTLFKDPPGEYRGHYWFGFNLANISEESVIAGVQRAAASNSAGSFMIGPGGGPTTGLSA